MLDTDENVVEYLEEHFRMCASVANLALTARCW